MKYHVTTFIVALLPVMPFVDYAVNSDKIVKNLYVSWNVKDSTCNGKCYLKKELAKTENQNKDGQNVKISSLTHYHQWDFYFSRKIFREKALNKLLI